MYSTDELSAKLHALLEVLQDADAIQKACSYHHIDQETFLMWVDSVIANLLQHLGSSDLHDNPPSSSKAAISPWYDPIEKRFRSVANPHNPDLI
jgi:hypothetical protein